MTPVKGSFYIPQMGLDPSIENRCCRERNWAYRGHVWPAKETMIREEACTFRGELGEMRDL